MPKGKVRKVSKKQVSKKRGKRISHKKRKVMKGGDDVPEPYSVGNKILYFTDGEVRYGNIIKITEKTETKDKQITVQRKDTSDYTYHEIIGLDNIIKSFNLKLINDIGIDLSKISNKMLETKF